MRGFEIAKGWEDKDIHLPMRSTSGAAAYDIEAAEDVIVPVFALELRPQLFLQASRLIVSRMSTILSRIAVLVLERAL